MKPSYAKNVITGVIYKKKFSWYVTHEYIWFMDYRKRYEEYRKWYSDMGRSEKRFLYETGTFEEYCGMRYGIAVLDRDSAEYFFDKIERYRISAEKLREMYMRADESERLAFEPAFYVDFDRRIFYSYFPEPVSYENYVPEGWQSEYREFGKKIPKKYEFREKRYI